MSVKPWFSTFSSSSSSSSSYCFPSTLLLSPKSFLFSSLSKHSPFAFKSFSTPPKQDYHLLSTTERSDGSVVFRFGELSKNVASSNPKEDVKTHPAESAKVVIDSTAHRTGTSGGLFEEDDGVVSEVKSSDHEDSSTGPPKDECSLEIVTQSDSTVSRHEAEVYNSRDQSYTIQMMPEYNQVVLEEDDQELTTNAVADGPECLKVSGGNLPSSKWEEEIVESDENGSTAVMSNLHKEESKTTGASANGEEFSLTELFLSSGASSLPNPSKVKRMLILLIKTGLALLMELDSGHLKGRMLRYLPESSLKAVENLYLIAKALI